MILTYVGMSGEISLIDYSNDYTALWTVESDCNKTHIFSTVFDTQGGADFVTVDGVMFSGQISFDLMVPNSFSVGFSSNNAITKPGFVLLWECQQIALESRCCSYINLML